MTPPTAKTPSPYLPSAPHPSMQLHPTVVLASGQQAQNLLAQLKPLWNRLGLAALALEAVNAGPESLGMTLRQLLDQQRVMLLHANGHHLTHALHLLWFVDGTYPTFSHEWGYLQQLCQDQLRGLEVQLHLLLLLPDVTAPVSNQTGVFEANFELLKPNSNVVPPTRVWPISMRNRADLHLQDPNHLLPLLQHMVEVCVWGTFPYHPDRDKGLDWAGVGGCRMQVAAPNPQDMAQQLWQTMQDSVVGQVAMPTPPVLQLPPTTPPPNTKRQSCAEYPVWMPETLWDTAYAQHHQSSRQLVTEAEEGWEPELPLELGRKALMGGLPTLKACANTLESALYNANQRLQQTLEPFDEACGLQGRRTRLARLLRRAEEGRPVPQNEVDKLRAEIEPVDSHLASGQLTLFVQNDPEVRQANHILEDARQRFMDNQARWNYEAKAAEATPKVPWWRRIVYFFTQRSQQQSANAQGESRKALCDYAWQQIEEGFAAAGHRAERLAFWDQAWANYRVALAFRDALAREYQQVLVVSNQLEGFGLPSSSVVPDSPLVMSFNPPYKVPPALLQQRAFELLKDGLLEYLWDRDLNGLQENLLREGHALAQQLAVPAVAQMMTSDAWTVATLAASPRIMVQHYPEHQAHAFLVGPLETFPWYEPITYQADWLDQEVLLFRFVAPLQPDQLLLWSPPLGNTVPLPPSNTPPAPRQEASNPTGSSERPNTLLEELFNE